MQPKIIIEQSWSIKFPPVLPEGNYFLFYAIQLNRPSGEEIPPNQEKQNVIVSRRTGCLFKYKTGSFHKVLYLGEDLNPQKLGNLA